VSQDTRQEHISKRAAVYRLPGMDDVEVRRDVEYLAGGAGARTMDIYRPRDFQNGLRPPAVVIVAGYPDAGFQRIVGCGFKEMGSTVSWARLLAASGLAAITYANREPEADLRALLRHVRRNAAAVEIDADRIGLWASSGNAPLALSALMREDSGPLRCAALCYGYMLDAEGYPVVADAASKFGFANPCAEKSVADLPEGLPLFVARAGRDETPGLNETIDRFVAEALKHNLPITIANHSDAPHAFDLFHDGETTREIVRQVLAFLRFQLSAAPAVVRA
jgi:hypothetical protein